ncbi:hypothetical protein [Roseivivax sediminis]|uniref:hypothetical protein n=1 Tax=Roseivivax sediminis TaxID=936889 RepID=UPI00122CDB61|nr:hypothetical protein [Roseivivax sediminis]
MSDSAALRTAQAMLAANAGAAAQAALSLAASLDTGPAKFTDNAVYLAGLGRSVLADTWISVHGKGFDGSVRGHAVTLTFGRDLARRGGARYGVAMSASRSALSLDGDRAQAVSAAIGPYLTRRFGEHIDMTGWGLLSLPRYTLPGRHAMGLRWTGALAASGRYTAVRTDLLGRLRLNGRGELDRGDGLHLSRHRLSAHAEGRTTFRKGAPLRPYLGVTTDLGLATAAPLRTTSRMTLGLAYRHARTRMSFDVDSGPLERPGPQTLRLSYGWRF